VTRYVLCQSSEIPPGESKLVNVKGRPVAIFNLDGEFFGLYNRCPHEGGSLIHGPRSGLVQSDEPGVYSYCRRSEIVRCPWHNWEFDIRTGQSVCRPTEVKARRFTMELVDGINAGEMKLAAETIELKLEGQYVVTDL
jgi:nitrite reductase/ring-hydroxylating ferredoxin subunit